MPMRHLTVTGIATAAFIAATQSPTRCRLRHQAGAEAAILHAIGRAAGIEIDLVKAEIGADARACGKRARIGAAELQRHRMLGRIVTQEAAPDRRAAPRRWSAFRYRAARGASAGDGRTGNAGRSIPSSERLQKRHWTDFTAIFLFYQSLR